jgi:uncharacterized membrane protein YozB (DUF420 family)
VNVTSGVATFNLVAQMVLMLVLLVGGWLAHKRKLGPHCLVMRTAIVIQLLLIGIIMAPQVGRYYANWSGFSGFTTELIVHHAFGSVAMVLAVYINLAFAGIIKKPRHFARVMRATFLAWAVSLALGIHLFWYLWR